MTRRHSHDTGSITIGVLGALGGSYPRGTPPGVAARAAGDLLGPRLYQGSEHYNLRALPTVHLLLSVRGQPTPEIEVLRALLTKNRRFPNWRTWERQLGALPATLAACIGCLGR